MLYQSPHFMSIGTTTGVATLSIQPKDQVIAHAGDTLIMNCKLTGLQQADQVWHIPWDYKYKEDPAQKERFTTQWTAQGILQLIVSPLTYQDAGSYQCKSEAAGLEKTVLVWIPGPDPITGMWSSKMVPGKGGVGSTLIFLYSKSESSCNL